MIRKNTGFKLAIKIKGKVTWTTLEIAKVLGEKKASPKPCPLKAIDKDLVLSISLKHLTCQSKDLIYSTCSAFQFPFQGDTEIEKRALSLFSRYGNWFISLPSVRGRAWKKTWPGCKYLKRGQTFETVSEWSPLRGGTQNDQSLVTPEFLVSKLNVFTQKALTSPTTKQRKEATHRAALPHPNPLSLQRLKELHWSSCIKNYLFSDLYMGWSRASYRPSKNSSKNINTFSYKNEIYKIYILHLSYTFVSFSSTCTL